MFTSDGVCIEAAAEGEDVQLVEFGDLLQELLAVRPQSRVQHGLPSAQLEVESALRREGRQGQKQSNLLLSFESFQVTVGGSLQHIKLNQEPSGSG